MSTLNIAMASLVITVLYACAGVVLTIKSRKARGDDRRRYGRMNLLWGMGFTVLMCGQAVFSFRQTGNGTLGLTIMLPILALALVMGIVGLWNMQTDRYFWKMYDHDPGFCGRCGYDLTGNTSGVCPECGWKLPNKQH
jgi:hypothetical protein